MMTSCSAVISPQGTHKVVERTVTMKDIIKSVNENRVRSIFLFSSHAS